MGRNNKPLKIGLISIDLENPTIQALKNKGHDIVDIMSWDEYFSTVDVFIGPRCWRIDPQLKLGDDSTQEESLERQLEMMEKGVRAIKYPKEKK